MVFHHCHDALLFAGLFRWMQSFISGSSTRGSAVIKVESERERRAKVINAEGEYQAAEKLVQAAGMMAARPIALQLRFLQTMREISSERNTTTFLPIPMGTCFPRFSRKAAKRRRHPRPRPLRRDPSGSAWLWPRLQRFTTAKAPRPFNGTSSGSFSESKGGSRRWPY